jgi:hypothetical protein
MRSRRNRAGWFALVLACAGLVGGGLAVTTASTASASSVLGLDFNTYPNPSTSTIAADGYSFVAQYLAGPGHLTSSSAADFHSHGISVVANWEMDPNSPLGGYSSGVSDAQNALADANAAGFPGSLPIYFSIDFSPSSSQMSEVVDYFHGVASVLGLSRTGAYGGYSTMDTLFNDGAISYGWQTYAWSNGQWDSRAQLRQIQNGITVGGTGVDEDQAMTASYGQWAPSGGGGGGTFRVGSHSSSISATPGGGYNAAWRGRDSNYSLWLASGTGSGIQAAGDPWLLGVAAGTTPSIATLPDGSWIAAWQAAGGTLWLATGRGDNITAKGDPWALGVAPGTSPSIVALPSGGWEVAWQASDSNGSLWLATGNGLNITAKGDPWALGVAPGTSPSLAALPSGGWEVAWQGRDSNGSLWLATGNGLNMTAKGDPWALGVAPGTSPSLTTLPNGSWEAAWQSRGASPGYLWLATGNGLNITAKGDPWLLGVAPGTSPSIDALPNGGFEVAWQAPGANGSLWFASGNGLNITAKGDPWALGVVAGTSPSIAVLPNGNFEVMWKGRDANQSLWLGTGNAAQLYSYGDPLLLGVG